MGFGESVYSLRHTILSGHKPASRLQATFRSEVGPVWSFRNATSRYAADQAASVFGLYTPFALPDRLRFWCEASVAFKNQNFHQ